MKVFDTLTREMKKFFWSMAHLGCNSRPGHAAASAAKDPSRVFTPWSHVVALIYQQLTKTESLNGVCDAARLHASQWQELRGAVPPRRNTFSNANQHRDPTMMETLYWKMLDYLGGLSPEFVSIRNPSVLARFKKRHIHLSTRARFSSSSTASTGRDTVPGRRRRNST